MAKAKAKKVFPTVGPAGSHDGDSVQGRTSRQLTFPMAHLDSRPSSAGSSKADKVEVGRLTREQKLKVAAAAGVAYGPEFSAETAILKFRKEKFREMLIYFVFVLFFTIGSLISRDVTGNHYFLRTARNLVLGRELESADFAQTFDDTASDEDCWEYLVDVVPNLLYTEQWYNGDAFTSEETGFWLHYNLIVGKPRLRQLRVATEPCVVPPRFESSYETCFPAYSSSTEDTTVHFGFNGTELPFQPDSELKSSSFGGQFFDYGGGGFVIDLPHPLNATQAEVKAILQDLKTRKWTDKATRALFFDFAMYNPTLNLFLSVRLLFEFLEYGAVTPVSSFRVMRMGMVSTMDRLSWGLDALVYCFVLYFMLQDIKKIRVMGPKLFFRDAWNNVNVLNYIVFFITLLFKVQYASATNDFVNSKTEFGENLLDFEKMGFLYMQIANWAAFNSVFVWVRTFSYLKFLNKSVADLVGTIGQAVKDCALFMVMFMLVMWAYAQAFYISLGQDIEDFSSISLAIFANFRAILGDFDFTALYESNPLLGPILFVTFQLVVFFIMLNMFLAIINKAYEDVVAQDDDDIMAIEMRNALSKAVARGRKALGLTSKTNAPAPSWASRPIVGGEEEDDDGAAGALAPIDEEDEVSLSDEGSPSRTSSRQGPPQPGGRMVMSNGGLSAGDRAALEGLVKAVQRLTVDVRTNTEKVDMTYRSAVIGSKGAGGASSSLSVVNSAGPRSPATMQTAGVEGQEGQGDGMTAERAWYKLAPAIRWAASNESTADSAIKQLKDVDEFDENLQETPRVGVA